MSARFLALAAPLQELWSRVYAAEQAAAGPGHQPKHAAGMAENAAWEAVRRANGGEVPSADPSISEGKFLRAAEEFHKLCARGGMPFAHTIVDLIGGTGAVTKCGACLTEKQKEREAFDPGPCERCARSCVELREQLQEELGAALKMIEAERHARATDNAASEMSRRMLEEALAAIAEEVGRLTKARDELARFHSEYAGKTIVEAERLALTIERMRPVVEAMAELDREGSNVFSFESTRKLADAFRLYERLTLASGATS